MPRALGALETLPPACPRPRGAALTAAGGCVASDKDTGTLAPDCQPERPGRALLRHVPCGPHRCGRERRASAPLGHFSCRPLQTSAWGLLPDVGAGCSRGTRPSKQQVSFSCQFCFLYLAKLTFSASLFPTLADFCNFPPHAHFHFPRPCRSLCRVSAVCRTCRPIAVPAPLMHKDEDGR